MKLLQIQEFIVNKQKNRNFFTRLVEKGVEISLNFEKKSGNLNTVQKFYKKNADLYNFGKSHIKI